MSTRLSPTLAYCISVDATSRDFEPSASNITFARLVLAATTNDRVPQPTHPVLPPRPVANAIVQHFMSNVYQLFTCFSDTALFTILHDVYEQHESSVKDSAYWLLYMVLAIGSTAQSQSINDEHYRRGVNFVAKALTYADRALAPGYLTQIQSLLLLTLYAMLDPAHFDSWHLIGFTARAVLDLGLHQDPPVSSASDKSLLDMRRKVFYCTYALDRAISMAHARSFSFTDDSVNVAFPTTQSPSQKPSTMANGPQSANPSLLLFQLRRAQSFWYQELYQSEPTPLANPLPFLWQMCLEMREWGQSLPESLPVGTRRMFEQELWYSYVYCIAPSARAPHITDYGRTLIFEYSLAYLNSMYETAHGGLNCAFYTYQDALKVYFMANQFIAVLRDAEEMLLSDSQVPPPLSAPGTAPPPPIPLRSGPTAMDNSSNNGNNNNNNVDRSLWCLEHISQTLDLYGARWGDATMLRLGFERISGETIQRLRSRRQMRNVGLPQPQRPPLQTVLHTVSPPAVMKREDQQLPSDIRWPAIDASQTAQDDGLC
ncbi:hypothetical protein CDD82_6978 [Ophiocordyceps australis]|uniref:Xylanolytic transcriptional activator regulatory domain-containing protein n=1 Tax=Ophiocordyceps australis TaxID=1399860 RepID=A0A2C5YT26_9HYPO|nr:hypothetical protein CDD82_6978 [Ophiocordyceps australis]